MNVELEQLVKEDIERHLVGRDVVDGDIKCPTFTTQLVHDRR